MYSIEVVEVIVAIKEFIRECRPFFICQANMAMDPEV